MLYRATLKKGKGDGSFLNSQNGLDKLGRFFEFLYPKGSIEDFQTFLKNNGVNLDIIEIFSGQYSLDRQWVKAKQAFYAHYIQKWDSLGSLSIDGLLKMLIRIGASGGPKNLDEIAIILDAYFTRLRPGRYPHELFLIRLFANRSPSRDALKTAIMSEDSGRDDDHHYSLALVGPLVRTPGLAELLDGLGVFSISDLSNLSDDFVSLLFQDSESQLDQISIINAITPCDYRAVLQTIGHRIEEASQTLKPREFEFLCRRYGIDGPQESLEEIGKSVNLTRERVRQIQQKAEESFVSNFKNSGISQSFISALNEMGRTDGIISYKDVTREMDCPKYLPFLKEFALKGQVRFLDCPSLSCFADSNSLALKIEESKEKIGYAIPCDSISDLTDFEQNVIENYYSNFREKLMIRKDINESDLYLEIIDQLFPQGFHFSDEESVQKVNDEFEKRYGSCLKRKNGHLLETYLERANYCLINRGVYLNRDRITTSISESFLGKILEYVSIQNRSVYYREVLEHFADECKALKVDNWFFLKGILDPLLPEGFEHKRDHISIQTEDGYSISPAASIRKWIQCASGVIDIRDFRNEFVGVKDYVFQFILGEFPNVVSLGDGKSIKLEQLNLESDDIDIIHEELEALISENPLGFTTPNKLWSRMNYSHPDLLAKIPPIKNASSFFSLSECLFRKNYFFNQSVAANTGSNVSNVYEALNAHFGKKEFVSWKAMERFMKDCGFRPYLSQREYEAMLSESHVVVSEGELVNKNVFENSVSPKEIALVDSCLDRYLRSYGILDCMDVSNSSFLPRIAYPWNRFLLVGLLQSYYPEKYLFSTKHETYNVYDFIIVLKS